MITPDSGAIPSSEPPLQLNHPSIILDLDFHLINAGSALMWVFEFSLTFAVGGRGLTFFAPDSLVRTAPVERFWRGNLQYSFCRLN